MNKNAAILTVLCLGVLLPSVANARPVPDLYPNQHLKSVTKVQADKDIKTCEGQTHDYLAGKQGDDGRPVARKAVRGAAVGAIAGSITGAGAGRGAGAGAAVGGTGAALDKRKGRIENENKGSPEYRKYMEACLDDMGYRVVGWRDVR